MRHFKTVLSAILLSSTVAISGCVSTTKGGVISPERKQLVLLSTGEVQRMSDEYYRQLIREASAKGKLDTNRYTVSRLREIADRIIPQTKYLREDAVLWDWKVHLITEDTLNAFVMPNAKIVFYSGIIDQLNLTDDEIAAIMGHEVAHALREHTREKMSRNMATNATIGIAASALGLGSGALQVIGLTSQYGLALPHSRSQEAEADAIGMELMARAGYNPHAAISIWQKMQAAKKSKINLEFLSTHPSSETRIKTMTELAPQVQHLYAQSYVSEPVAPAATKKPVVKSSKKKKR